MGFAAKVRGIYASALVKMLLDYGFDVVDPSAEQSARFGLVPKETTPDISIRDRDDKQGIVCRGTLDAIAGFTKILRENLTDVVIRRGVVEGSRDFEFPSTSKAELDKIRNKTAMTITRHHFFKACGESISASVDMAERLLERGKSQQEVEKLFMSSVEPYLPFEGSVVQVVHVKPSGAVLTLGQATVLRNDEEVVLYRRKVRNSGTYDGLGVKRQPGDLAITRTHLGAFYTETGYFSASGIFKGAYVNMGTPVELYPRSVRYVDLEIDLSVPRDGFVTVLDDDLLRREAESETISWRFYRVVEEKVKELLHLYSSDISELSSLYELGR